MPRIRGLRLFGAVGLLGGLVAAIGLHFFRNFPWFLASMSGVGVGGLAFTTLQTVDRLRRQFREDP